MCIQGLVHFSLDDSLAKATVLLTFSSMDCFCIEVIFFTFKPLRCRQYPYQNVTKFSQGNNMQDTPASNKDVFLTRKTVLLLFI
jgi:hypothetical protein